MQEFRERGLIRLRLTSLDPEETGSYTLIVAKEYWKRVRLKLERGTSVLVALDDYLCVLRAQDGESISSDLEKLVKEKNLGKFETLPR